MNEPIANSNEGKLYIPQTPWEYCQESLAQSPKVPEVPWSQREKARHKGFVEYLKAQHEERQEWIRAEKLHRKNRGFLGLLESFIKFTGEL